MTVLCKVGLGSEMGKLYHLSILELEFRLQVIRLVVSHDLSLEKLAVFEFSLVLLLFVCLMCASS